MTTKKPDNLDLWRRHEKTNPAITKYVDLKGGFTAIAAQAQIEQATEEWGPMGIAWGLRDCVYGYVYSDTAPLEAWIEAKFFYPNGVIEISTDIAFRVGGDNRKKLRTDAITKALSNLGFSADVFRGKFDDNKYVAEMKKEFASDPEPAIDYKVMFGEVNMQLVAAATLDIVDGINTAWRHEVAQWPDKWQVKYTRALTEAKVRLQTTEYGVGGVVDAVRSYVQRHKKLWQEKDLDALRDKALARIKEGKDGKDQKPDA